MRSSISSGNARGKRRIHKIPGLREVRACRPWLDAELDAVRPDLIVCLGAVAAQGLLGSGFRITVSRGVIQYLESLPPIIATVHPSSILRAATDQDRERETALFIKDLKRAASSPCPLNSSALRAIFCAPYRDIPTPRIGQLTARSLTFAARIRKRPQRIGNGVGFLSHRINRPISGETSKCKKTHYANST